MKQQWEKLIVKLNAKLSAMSLRERAMIFAAIGVLVVSLTNTFLLDPLFVRQKSLRSQMTQQQRMVNEFKTQIATLMQENAPNSTSPQRKQIILLKQEIAEGEAYLQSNREKLVQPDKMAEHLRQILNRNNRLQLLALQTLPASPLMDPTENKGAELSKVAQAAISQDKQVYKHGVELTLRGNYLDLLQYLVALERLPQQMYWAKAKMNVAQYPAAELTLIVYTLSLDNTWLKI